MNYTLAFEASTATPSAALLHDDLCLGETSWLATRGASQHMYNAVVDLLKTHSATLDAVTLFAVGLGPGGFTGLRLSLAAMQAMALPDKTPVIGVSSAEALAYRIQQAHAIHSGRILVLGDARRKRLWVGTFEATPTTLTQASDFALVPIADFAATLTSGDTLISPDWDRLDNDLSGILPDNTTCIREHADPTATDVAQRVRFRVKHEIPSPPLEPIYMHPPVFVEPRFTEAAKRSL
jgi:tRNA threonylcarbamoyl adenosine modification protein YeaZ